MCQPPYKLYWSRSMTFKYVSILTRWMTLFNGIFSFKLSYLNEIFISSNKNHHYFLQFNEVINGIFILFLVIFGTYQIICELLLLRSTVESLVGVVPLSYGKPISLKNILCIFCHRKGHVINRILHSSRLANTEITQNSFHKFHINWPLM